MVVAAGLLVACGEEPLSLTTPPAPPVPGAPDAPAGGHHPGFGTDIGSGCGAHPPADSNAPPTDSSGPPTTLHPTTPMAGTWTELDPGPLAPRAEAIGVWTGSEVLIFGGLSVEHYRAFADGARHDPVTGQWRRITDRPVGGRVLVGAWTGRELFTLGRQDGIDLADMRLVHLYDPATDQWRTGREASPAFTAPAGAFWTGSEVLVWEREASQLYDPARDTWRPLPPPGVPGLLGLGWAIWMPEVGLVAAQATVDPRDGSPPVETIATFDPASDSWAVAPPPPRPVSLLLSAGWWGDRLVIGPPDGAGQPLAFEPVHRTWSIHAAAHQAGGILAWAYRSVPLGGGRAAIVTGALSCPIVVGHPDDTWSYPDRPAGPVATNGVDLWIGDRLWTWGRLDTSTGPQDPPMRAWTWTPAG